MRGRVVIILLSLTGLGLPAHLLSYNDDSTHYELTQEVVDFYSAASSRVFSSEERETIARGAVHEDIPPRWVNHFYDPIHNEPWLARYFGTANAETAFASAKTAFGIERTYTAKDWSQNESAQNKYQAYKGNRTFQRALYEYTQGDKKEALYTLGFVLHLIEDMTVPDHTRGDTHYENDLTKDIGSPYEKWAEQLTRSTNLTIAQNLIRQKVKPLPADSLNEVFDAVASYSNNNFFSEDTIDDIRFQLPSFTYLGGNFFGVKSQGQELKLFYFDDKDPNNPVKTINKPAILQGYWSRLSPLAVRAGAGIMDYFFREVERIEKDKVVLENPTSWSKRLAGGLVVSPYGEVNRTERAATTVKALAVSLGVAAKDTFGAIAQKVKLAVAATTEILKQVQDDNKQARDDKNQNDKGQVLGEAVEAAGGITNSQTPIIKKEAEATSQGSTAVIASGARAKRSNPEKSAISDGIASVAPRSLLSPVALAKGDGEGGLQNDKMLKPLNQVQGQHDGRETGGPEPEGEQRDSSPALREGRGRNDGLDSRLRGNDNKESRNDKEAAPVSDTPTKVGLPISSLPRRGTAGPSFIGIHAPAPATPSISPETSAANTTVTDTVASTPDTSHGIPSSTPETIPSSTPDAIPPTTWITILSATTTVASFLVQWSGTDNVQPTPASYDVQYQTITLGGGAASSPSYPWQVGAASFNANYWLDWLLATSAASSTFTGQDEKTYGFRSRGRDQEGNQSIYPSNAETFTYLNLSVPSAPTITSHQNNQTLTYSDDTATSTDGVQITLVGAAEPSDTISITYSSSITASSTAWSTASTLGAWSKQLTLSEGANTITLQSQEADGDVSSFVNITLNLEITPTRQVVINEIAWMGTAASAYDEWLELYNTGDAAVDLTGWTLSAASGAPAITLAGAIAAKSYFLLERTDDATVNNQAADQIYTGALSNDGELLTLRNSDNTLVDRVGSSTVAWFSGSNSSSAARASMERKDPTESGQAASNWADNDAAFVSGQDADNANLKATPRSLNSVNTTIPRPTTDLTIQHVYTAHNTIKLYWTAPRNGNLNASGQAAYYDIRYASGVGCAISENSFGSATQVSGEPAVSATAGAGQTATVSGLNPSAVYCFALKTYNGASISGLSNVVSATTHASPASNPLTRLGFLNDTFPNGYAITVSGSPYLADTSLRIAAGTSVTIEAGVVIKMADANSQWLIDGQLAANGTALNPVVITSVKDDTFAGDTNNNGSATWPNGGDWYRFQVSGSAARLTLNSTIMRYGGRAGSPMIALTNGAAAAITGSILEHSSQNAIAMGNDSTGLTLTNSTLRNNDLEGVGISSRANAAIQGSTFTNNRRGIAIDTNADVANLTISGNNFYANNANQGSAPNAGIHFSDADDTLTAANNWWGSALGPTTASPDNDSARDAALGNINYTPFSVSAFPILPSGF